jgi:hypothetical protein
MVCLFHGPMIGAPNLKNNRQAYRERL